jgi:hypothetical protein
MPKYMEKTVDDEARQGQSDIRTPCLPGRSSRRQKRRFKQLAELVSEVRPDPGALALSLSGSILQFYRPFVCGA